MANKIKKLGYFTYFYNHKNELDLHDAYKITILIDLYVVAETYQKNPTQDNLNLLLNHVMTAMTLSWKKADLFGYPMRYYETLTVILDLVKSLLPSEQRKDLSKLRDAISIEPSLLHDPLTAITDLTKEAENHAKEIYPKQERQHSTQESAAVTSKKYEPLKLNFLQLESPQDLGKAIELIAKRYSERTTKILKNKELFERMIKIITDGIKKDLELPDIIKQITDNVRVKSAFLSLFDSTVSLKDAELIVRLIHISMIVEDQQLTLEEKREAILYAVDEMLDGIGWVDYQQGVELLMILALVEQSLGTDEKLEALRFKIEGMGDAKRQKVFIKDLEKDMKGYAAEEAAKVKEVEPPKPASRPGGP
jgi:hypothetical protein